MKAIAALIVVIWICLEPLAAQSYVPEDGSVAAATHAFVQSNPGADDVVSSDYGGKVPSSPALVLYTPKIKNPTPI